MRIWIEIGAAVLFVISTGLLYSEWVRARHLVFTLVGVAVLASSYVLVKHVLYETFGHQHRHRPAVVAAVPPAATAPDPAPIAASADMLATDTLLEAVYDGTETALNRIVRAGTKQSSASVSSDTVVDVIVGVTIAVLGVLSQVLSGLFRRLSGAEP